MKPADYCLEGSENRKQISIEKKESGKMLENTGVRPERSKNNEPESVKKRRESHFGQMDMFHLD